MAASSPHDSRSETVQATLAELGSRDRELFLEVRRQLLEEEHRESPLLDQLCLLRVITTRLAEGYAGALAKFEARLEQRIRMRPGWRRMLRHKSASDHESPMPWLHPLRLAHEALVAMQDQVEQDVSSGETRDAHAEQLAEVLARHGLALPLSGPV